MTPELPSADHRRFLRLIQLLLTVVLLVKLAGFFTWSEGVNSTRFIKMSSRLAMTVAVYGVYRLILHRGAVDSFRWQNSLAPVLYAGYLLLGLASLLWSSDPGYSLLQLVMDAESFLFAYYFVKCFLLLGAFFPAADIRFYRVLGDAALALILVFVAGGLLAPETFFRLTHAGEEARLGGFLMNPNELGMLCVVGISCLSFDIYHRHNVPRTVAKMLPLLWALVLTGSRSSLVGLLLLVLLHIGHSGSRRLQLGGVVAVLLAVPVAVRTLFIKQGGLEEVLSLTGRLPFWQALLTEGLPKEPLLGFGFQRIAYTDYFQGTHTYAAQMTHNTFIQVLLNLGLVGFTLAMLQLGFTLRGFVASPQREQRLILLGLLIPILINSFTEFGIFGLTNYGILFYQLLIFLISLRYHPLLTSAEHTYLLRKRPELRPVPAPLPVPTA